MVLASLTACVDSLPAQDLRILGAAPDAKLSAELLWKEFQADPSRARRDYFGKVVEITGTATLVEEVEEEDDERGGRDVLFAQTGESGVRANLLDEQAAEILASVKEQPRVTLKCYCEGLTGGDLILRSCVKP